MLREIEVVRHLVSQLIEAGIADVETEVKCKLGSVDILTYSTIVEVKVVNDWKHAIGQVISYNSIFKKFKKIIVLFDKDGSRIKRTDHIFNVCKENGIYLFLYHPSKDFSEFLIKYKLDQPRDAKTTKWHMNKIEYKRKLRLR